MNPKSLSDAVSSVTVAVVAGRFSGNEAASSAGVERRAAVYKRRSNEKDAKRSADVEK